MHKLDNFEWKSRVHPLALAGSPFAALLVCALLSSPFLFAQADDSFDADSFFSQGTTIIQGEIVPAESMPALSTNASLVFSGEASANLVYSVLNPLDTSGAHWEKGTTTSFGTLRLDATGGNREYVKVEASLITLLAYGGSTDETTEIVASLKKLYFSVYTGVADISVGRMIVNYGRGTVFSPVDLFSITDTADLALGRTGTDAARVLFPLGVVSGLDLVSSLGADMAESTFGGRFFSNLSGWDFGVSGFRSGRSTSADDVANTTECDALTLGLDFKGDIELGISGELVCHIPLDWSGVSDGLALQTMLGCDYSLGNAWFFDLEYLWNFADADEAEALLNGAFRGDHTVFTSVSWTPDEFGTLDLRCMGNLATLDWQLTGSVSRTIAQGATVGAFMLWQSGNVEGGSGEGSSAAADASGASAGLRLTVSF